MASPTILENLTPYLTPVDELLTALQLRFLPDRPATSLLDLLPHAAATLGIVLVASVFLMRRFFGLNRDPVEQQPYRGPISGNDNVDPHRPDDVLTIKHGSDEYLFRYPRYTIAEHKLNVGHVREKCAEITGVDFKRLKLICHGRELKDDNATLKSIGIEHNGKILCVGSNAPPAGRPAPKDPAVTKRPTPAASPVPKKPNGPSELIEAVREEMEVKLKPLIEDFVSNPPETDEKAKDMHRRLTETVMTELLRLDGAVSDEPEIRQRRKDLVKSIQGTLESLDNALNNMLVK